MHGRLCHAFQIMEVSDSKRYTLQYLALWRSAISGTVLSIKRNIQGGRRGAQHRAQGASYVDALAGRAANRDTP